MCDTVAALEYLPPDLRYAVSRWNKKLTPGTDRPKEGGRVFLLLRGESWSWLLGSGPCQEDNAKMELIGRGVSLLCGTPRSIWG